VLSNWKFASVPVPLRIALIPSPPKATVAGFARILRIALPEVGVTSFPAKSNNSNHLKGSSKSFSISSWKVAGFQFSVIPVPAIKPSGEPGELNITVSIIQFAISVSSIVTSNVLS